MTPDKYTITEKYIDTKDGHSLYVQLWGSNSPESKTVIYLHGGPGSGCSDSAKDHFDPTLHKVIFFDQRGSGLSKPYGSLENNTTQHLVDDISLIADSFKIDRFSLVGGSWGSTLALAYAIANPERVESMVIRGILTGARDEIEFFEKGNFRSFFPEAWENYVSSVPEEYRSNPADYHQERIVGDDPEIAKQSAYEYSKLEYAVIGLDDRRTPEGYQDFDPTNTIIEVSYMKNLCFMENNYVLNNASKFTMPIWIVQGRYDAICAPSNAYRLHQKLPNSKLIWTIAGHSGSDRANRDVVKSLLLAI